MNAAEVLLTRDVVPSAKFQVYAVIVPAGVVDASVNETAFVSQTGEPTVKLATGGANTMICLEAVSTQPPDADVYVYKMLCVPTPATAGLNKPVGDIPGPVNLNVPGTPPVSVACVI